MGNGELGNIYEKPGFFKKPGFSAEAIATRLQSNFELRTAAKYFPEKPLIYLANWQYLCYNKER
ncbi:MAG: hypothetical protein F6J93_27625 [Oscillatoria sp. SIO1A7]|nr:hypothetical protein [Oscillatoria sp. SIO1A7]